jgi:hypothetical protein
MKFLAALLAVCLTGTTLVSANPHGSNGLSNHARIVRRRSAEGAPQLTRRCKARSPPKASSTKADKPAETKDKDNGKDDDKHNDGKSSSGNSSGSSGGKNDWSTGGGGNLLVASGPCGSSGATAKITATSGPNGNMEFFNCGIEGGGWNPPHITVEQLKSVDLSTAVKQPGSPFKACQNFVGAFEKYAAQHGYPAILLAAFAMQESSCNPETVGGNGEQGLMQITKEKCKGAPGGNCRDPDFNIRTGAAYFANNLKEDGGNILLSIGRYNGWHKGMTHSDAVRAAKQGHCFAQNNLDYLQQFLNGWMQNKNAYDYSFRLGKYFNLDQCN